MITTPPALWAALVLRKAAAPAPRAEKALRAKTVAAAALAAKKAAVLKKAVALTPMAAAALAAKKAAAAAHV